MGKVNRSFRRKKMKGISDAELKTIENDVIQLSLNKMTQEYMQIALYIVNNHWKDLTPKDTRTDVFCELFRQGLVRINEGVEV